MTVAPTTDQIPSLDAEVAEVLGVDHEVDSFLVQIVDLECSHDNAFR
jgi:hypothetical protein